MSLPDRPLSYAEASALVCDRALRLRPRPYSTEVLDLSAAWGRVLAQPVLADRDQPPFARSTRDGFAGRAR